MSSEIKDEICTVCATSFTDIKRKAIKCVFCKYTYCRECLQMYLMSGENKNNCMHCNRVLSDEFIEAHTSRIFMEKYNKIVFEETVLRKEKEMVPITTQLAGVIKEGNNALIYEETMRLVQFENTNTNDDIRKFNINLTNCPKVGCNGYVSEKTKWICTICNEKTCSVCLCSMKESHKCEPIVLESIKAIKSTSKECPGCKVYINRVSGCSQMYCTNCGVVFDWNTGKIEVGKYIHNPHYLQELQRKKQDNNPYNHWLYNHEYWIEQESIITHMIGSKNEFSQCLHIYKQIIELRDVYEIKRKLYRETQRELNEYQKLRIKYILKEITEEKWKTRAFTLHKKEKKYKYTEQVYTILIEKIVHIMTVAIENIYKDASSVSVICSTLYTDLKDMITETNTFLDINKSIRFTMYDYVVFPPRRN